MAVEGNVAAVRRYWEGFNAHNLDVWDEVCAPGYLNHDPGLPTPEADLATLKRTIGELLLAALPDLTSSEDDLIATDDKVVVRRTFRGTHRGELMGHAPTGKQVAFTAIFIDRLVDGKIEEQWVNFDVLGLLRQIGALPPPTPSA